MPVLQERDIQMNFITDVLVFSPELQVKISLCWQYDNTEVKRLYHHAYTFILVQIWGDELLFNVKSELPPPIFSHVSDPFVFKTPNFIQLNWIELQKLGLGL